MKNSGATPDAGEWGLCAGPAYAFWREQAEGIDYSLITRYDTPIGDAWATAVACIKTNEKTKEEAINVNQ